MIYADNAATTKLDIDAFESMRPFLIDNYGNASQPYSFSRKCRQALKNARQTIAECIGALPEEIYFTSGGTESDNWATKGIMLNKQSVNNNHMITSVIEHHAILNSCAFLSNHRIDINYVGVDYKGIVCPNELEKVLSSNTKLVSIMMANNEIGTIEPIKDLAKVTHDNGSLFHTDAVQAMGHIPINVNDLGVDMLSASGHKFNGPKGIGFLYIKNGTSIIPFQDGGSQEFGMRAGTENIASIVAMTVALEKNCKELQQNMNKINKLRELFKNKLSNTSIDYVINGSDNTLPGIISLSIKGLTGEMILHRLDLLGIAISTGSACNSEELEVSNVIKSIKVDEAYAKGTIRISLGKENSEDDIIEIVKALNKVCVYN